ncbi:MAG: hypothetical protein ABW043_12380 [Devosia sp.]|uniref:hypothetical protein n=1 Tax=Devosia sp. TaxID=1871048 RepID=UPI0033914D0D
MSNENRVSDERLAEIVGAGVPCVPMQPGEAARIVQELRSLRSKPVAGVEVKPLDWTCIAGYDGHFWRATDPVSGCEVTAYTGDQKARHEADYRQRTLSTLSLPAQEPVATFDVVEMGKDGMRGATHLMPELWWSKYPAGSHSLYASPQLEAVTDEMVERAARRIYEGARSRVGSKSDGSMVMPAFDDREDALVERDLSEARAALTAALKEA